MYPICPIATRCLGNTSRHHEGKSGPGRDAEPLANISPASGSRFGLSSDPWRHSRTPGLPLPVSTLTLTRWLVSNLSVKAIKEILVICQYFTHLKKS